MIRIHEYISQLLKLSIYCDDLHLLKMYFPQYKYMTFMYSYHVFNLVFNTKLPVITEAEKRQSKIFCKSEKIFRIDI